VLEDSKNVDAVVLHEGEWVVEQILNLRREKKFPLAVPGVVFREKGRIRTSGGTSQRIPINDLPFLKYELYPDYLKRHRLIAAAQINFHRNSRDRLSCGVKRNLHG